MKKVIRLTESDLSNIIKRVIKETRIENQYEIDRILDKISEMGIDSLTRSERMTLSGSDVKGYSSKDEIIGMIVDITDNCGLITTGDLQRGSDILLQEIDGEIHLIDGFNSGGVNVTIYGGYKNETMLGEYTLPYEKLNIDILEEILNDIEDYEC